MALHNDVMSGDVRVGEATDLSVGGLARQTGVLIQLPSAMPLAPSGVASVLLSWCNINGSGISHAVGTR